MNWKALLWSAALLFAGLPAHADRNQLLHGFDKIRADRSASPFEEPIFIRSRNDGDHLGADIFAVLPQPFSEVRAALVHADEWCQFLVLNQNVKACTWRPAASEAKLSLFVGRKYYQPPEDAFKIHGDFDVKAVGDEYLRVTLRAPEGPLGTQDYRISVEATPLEQGTLVQLSWGYEDSWRSRMATSTYLATLGRDKVGFTVVARDRFGKPQFVQGVRGIIERNAMRYYLALRAYLDNDHLAEDQRLRASMNSWYELSENYARQLHELERQEYFDSKLREWRNQRRMQRQVSAEADAPASSY